MATLPADSDRPANLASTRLNVGLCLRGGLNASQDLRSKNVAATLRALQAGDFDAARYESTPRLRAERLAQVLTRALSRGAMRRRLKRLGFAPKWQNGTLLAVSVEGGGLDVQLPGGEGQVRTGPGVDADLLAVFPELLQHTLTNLQYQVPPGAGDAAISISNPSTSGSNALYVNTTLYLPSYLGTSAVARYNAVGTGTLPGTSFTAGTVTDPFGSAVSISGLDLPQLVTFAWSAAGLNWIEINAGQTNVSPGNKSLSFGTDWTTWTAGLNFQYVTVTYTNPPCATCRIDLQVNSGCDASGLGGAIFTLNNGLNCTTAGGGGCSISGIPDGDYTYTIVLTGYTTLTGSFTCACGGGTTVLSVLLTPTGGCDACDLAITVLDWCTGLALAGALISADGGASSCITNGSGVCTLTNLSNGDHTIVISLSGYASQSFTWRCNSGSDGAFSVTLVPNAPCTTPPPPPPPDSETGPCFRVTFGAMERQGVTFGAMQQITTAWFGAMERQGIAFGAMRKS